MLQWLCNRGDPESKQDRPAKWNHRQREDKTQRLYAACPRSLEEREVMGRRPDARWACSGMVYGLRAEQKKSQKEEDQFQCFFPTCQNSLMDVLTFIKKSWSCWFLQARCQRWYGESARLSPVVNPRDSHWASPRHLQDIWYCIFHFSLWAQAQLSFNTAKHLMISLLCANVLLIWCLMELKTKLSGL